MSNMWTCTRYIGTHTIIDKARQLDMSSARGACCSSTRSNASPAQGDAISNAADAHQHKGVQVLYCVTPVARQVLAKSCVLAVGGRAGAWPVRLHNWFKPNHGQQRG